MAGPDLFSEVPGEFLGQDLAGLAWPAPERVLVNHAQARVGGVLVADLARSTDPLLVAGYSSIAQLVDLIAAWDARGSGGQLRVVLGSEPAPSARSSFAAPQVQFTEEVRKFWLAQGISLRLSGKVVTAMAALDAGRVAVRAVGGEPGLHAKLYVADQAATVGSSNFSQRGLYSQFEANARFDAATEPDRYAETRQVAQNFWTVGQPWDEAFRTLLRDLLRFVTWQEALARACADLLEGEWARRYLPGSEAGVHLWPSQVAGIAQALWVIDNVGSVLVADATGSGKTRMGAHLTRAVRDRLYQTGRVRKDLAVLVAPPGVARTWTDEARRCGLALDVISHGRLSTADGASEDDAVRDAQILALDESHNFLNKTTKRTRKVTGNAADHVLLFTATPISRGAADLLSLVQLLGPDNFDDTTIDTLLDLERHTATQLTAAQYEALRAQIRRFTVRRTKRMLNELVDVDPDAYRDPGSGRVNRYPQHASRTYPTGESPADEEVAWAIRSHAGALRGLVNLGRQVSRPGSGWAEVGDERVLGYRLAAARGLAAHLVYDAMRSSRAALIEHVAGTRAAADFEGLTRSFKNTNTGDMLTKITAARTAGPPAVDLDCPLPDWLTDPDAWAQACEEELELYQRIDTAARTLSHAREQAKAALIAGVQASHPRVLAFDHHPITLAVLDPLVRAAGAHHVMLASGSDQNSKKTVGKALGREATEPAVALCSDALNEGLNLQGASAVIHLDLPTTLRAAEQRVGRVDRMNSPYDTIESHWPIDGPAFATRAAERLQARARATSQLLGANLDLPDLDPDHPHTPPPDELVNVKAVIAELEDPDVTWDGITDALDPVRALIGGDTALIPPAVYREHQHTSHMVISRVSPVHATTPWAFLAITGTEHGAPHWILLEADPDRAAIGLDDVVTRLRDLLADDPTGRPFDDTADRHLQHFLTRAEHLEDQLLPRRLARARDQMCHLTAAWRKQALGRGNEDLAQRWERLNAFASRTGADRPDPYRVGQAWYDLVKPHLAAHQRTHRTRLARLRDITPHLTNHPLPITDVETAMTGIPEVTHLDTRIAACILGVPG
jgi:hypothetical protein